MNKEEYFKIKDTLSLIKIAKENNSPEETITKNYVNYLSTNVNLMRESAKFERSRIVKKIDDLQKQVVRDSASYEVLNKLKAVLSGGSE